MLAGQSGGAVTADDEERAIAGILPVLTTEFPNTTGTMITDAVAQARARFASAPIRDFVPLLVLREARRHLRGGPTRTAATLAPG